MSEDKKSRCDDTVAEMIDCADCHEPFAFTKGEEVYYKDKNLSKPRRCKPCRDIRKQQKQGQSSLTT